MKKYTFKEIKRIGIKKRDALSTKILFDPLAIPLVYIFANKLKISPSTVTVLSFFIGILSGIYFYFGNFLLGAVFWYVFFLLDCVDGKLARVTKKTSTTGAFLDLLLGSIVTLLSYFGLCVRLIKLGVLTNTFFQIFLSTMLIAAFVQNAYLNGLRRLNTTKKVKSIKKKINKISFFRLTEKLGLPYTIIDRVDFDAWILVILPIVYYFFPFISVIKLVALLIELQSIYLVILSISMSLYLYSSLKSFI